MCTLSDLFAQDGLAITKINVGQEKIIVHAQSSAAEAACPSCHVKSNRVHSRYARSINDLPILGRQLQIQLNARKLFCENEKCPQRIFCERFSTFADSHARSTKRLNLALCKIGLAAGAEGGARLAQILSIPTSGDTVLRRLHTAPLPQMPPPHVIGVDDWAYKKGLTYGTIICDLERGCPIDMLADRNSESLCNWLKEHPDVRIVSRDRSILYANGITAGAPLAIQVADRWHLLKNARDKLKRIADRCRTEIREVTKSLADTCMKNEENTLSTCPEHPPSSAPLLKRVSQQSRERKKALYHEVQRLHRQGYSLRGITQRLGIQRKTVRKYVRSKEFPERAVTHRPTTVDRHGHYLQKRWREGCHNAAQLYRELKDEGFNVSYYAIRRFVKSWRGNTTAPLPQQIQFSSPSSSRVSWLLLMDAEKLTEYEQTFVTELQNSCSLLQSAGNRLREFTAIVRGQRVEDWEAWLELALQKGEPLEIRNFAKSLQADEAAVKAALEYPWSNGPVEGQINRLKTLKRQMYGRANFDLLRRRVLLPH